MRSKTVLIAIVVLFLVACGAIVFNTFMACDSCRISKPCILLQKTAQDTIDSHGGDVTKIPVQIQPAAAQISFVAENADQKTVILGAQDPNTENPQTGYKLQIELASQGASIKKAVFSDGQGLGFDNRDPKNPKPLALLSPVSENVLSMANTEFMFLEQKLQLNLSQLNWQVTDVKKDPNGTQSATFTAVVKEKNTNQPTIRLTKIYKVRPKTYLLDCSLNIENLSQNEQRIAFNLRGPVGVNKEGVRADMRKTVAGFINTQKKITSKRIGLRKFDENKTFDQEPLEHDSDKFLWAAITNKYFTAVIVPEPQEKTDYAKWVSSQSGTFFNPDGKKNTGDENVAVNLKIASYRFAPAGQAENSKLFNFKLYIGPKDKKLFTENPLYKRLGFVQTIDFMTCCCPAAFISPLAFGIIAAMEWLYGFIPNYGVIIIIFVFLIRLAMHPITKKSQLSMSKMQNLGPQLEEIKKKYANNKTEIQKHTMEVYKQQGVSPMMGIIPMFIQMPIWISLYSAIYASIALRGAPFLPFWITDLSAPDALFRFSPISIPIFGSIDSFNLLPILMGLAFYFQQKLMPKNAASQANSQVAQQQKMMMVMMPILFPLMLYKAPSGLNLYIMASTFAGVIEQYVIRKHIREKQEAEKLGLVSVTKKTGGKVKKKKPKPFFKNH